jgi:hypothetical protein
MTRSSGDYTALLYPHGEPNSSEDLIRAPSSGQAHSNPHAETSGETSGGRRTTYPNPLAEMNEDRRADSFDTAESFEMLQRSSQSEMLQRSSQSLPSDQAPNAEVDGHERLSVEPGRLSQYDSRSMPSDSVTSI